ncbi:MAG: BON domain-containing protein [Limnochordales bacterium]|nr:BON domain-containing protein [Limnochordales bacterium]
MSLNNVNWTSSRHDRPRSQLSPESGTGCSDLDQEQAHNQGLGLDEKIEAKVRAVLRGDRELQQYHLQAEVHEGEVKLAGTVREGEHRRRAEELVEDVPGVLQVQNEIRVERQG